MTPEEYFNNLNSPTKKQYDALREYFHYSAKSETVAEKYGYTLSSFYWLIKDFKRQLNATPDTDFFFQERRLGRKKTEQPEVLRNFVVTLRKQNYSADDIVIIGHAKKYNLNFHTVYQILKDEGFAPLYRRQYQEKMQLTISNIEAPRAEKLSWEEPEEFQSSALGILHFLPYIKKYGIDNLIQNSSYPQTRSISRMSSILCFLALKLSNINRYSNDDLWCMDRGAGLFGGLNVLPKTAWYSSYSSGITRQMNLSFLKSMHRIWLKNKLLSDTCNMDFTTIPYWGEEDPLENNWSGKRNKALLSMLAVLAQDPDSGLIDYGDTTILHKNQDAVVLEFLDFYRDGKKKNCNLKYLVFDSKFTNYENLARLDDNHVKFITIRRRGKNIIDEIKLIAQEEWKNIRVECAGNKTRILKVNDSTVFLNGYEKNIRQIIITGHGKEKPALVITNDFLLPVEQVVRKYSKRWLIEKANSEQIEFFHLNRVSSGMVIKVDFDLTMSILAHNLYRLIALDLEQYSRYASPKIYRKFIVNSGKVNITQDTIEVRLKKKRNLPLLLETSEKYQKYKYDWLDGRKVIFIPASTT